MNGQKQNTHSQLTSIISFQHINNLHLLSVPCSSAMNRTGKLPSRICYSYRQVQRVLICVRGTHRNFYTRTFSHQSYRQHRHQHYPQKYIPHPFSRDFNTNFSSSTSSHNRRRIHAALDLLHLSHHDSWTQKELRDAYFTAAKQCHPDVRHQNGDNDNDAEQMKADLSNQFLEITEAYELLQTYGGVGGKARPHHDGSDKNPDENYNYITLTEEQQFRQACIEYLGIDAEIVEESKRCPMFRKWLKGRSVDAFHWNLFLMKNGGLAPMLRGKKVLNLTEGDGSNGGSSGDGKQGPGRRRRKR